MCEARCPSLIHLSGSEFGEPDEYEGVQESLADGLPQPQFENAFNSSQIKVNSDKSVHGRHPKQAIQLRVVMKNRKEKNHTV